MTDTLLPAPAAPPDPVPTAPASPRARPDRRATQDATTRVVATGLLWLAVLLVTWWWTVDRGLQDLATWSGALTSVGRLSGLVGSVLLLVQVVLMARLPVLERAYGQDRLARQHRVIGFTSFTLVLVHVVMVTWGYAAGSLLAAPATLWRLTLDSPGVLLADAGLVCLVLVVVTSVRVARRRLRYESWHLLHLYAYLGVGLALPHQLWTGSELVSSPWRTAFWWTAWGATAGLVLVTRVGRPVVLTLRHRLRVAAVVPQGPGTWSVHVVGRRMDRFPAEAGQFLVWRFLAGPGWSRGNPYSLSAAPDGRGLRLTVQEAGDGSRTVAHLRPGTRVLVEGPFGRLSARARTRRGVLLLGAGVGMAPLHALAQGLPYAPGDVVYLERSSGPALFPDETAWLARHRGLRVLWLPGPRRHDGSWLSAHAGAVDDAAALRWWVPDVAERDVYVCGPPAWAALVRTSLQACGLLPDQIHLETFSW